MPGSPDQVVAPQVQIAINAAQTAANTAQGTGAVAQDSAATAQTTADSALALAGTKEPKIPAGTILQFFCGNKIWTDLETAVRAFLSTVAKSGSYNDLLNKPNLFSGNYGDLTSKPALFSGNYSDLTNKPANATPTTAGFQSADDKAKLDGFLGTGTGNISVSLPTIALAATYTFDMDAPGAKVNMFPIVQPELSLLTSLSFCYATITTPNKISVTIKTALALTAGSKNFRYRVLP